jgi:hypothetical protein
LFASNLSSPGRADKRCGRSIMAARAPDKERADALAQMNLTRITRAYIQQMIDEVPGYKALLLDKDTMRVCSTVYGRTELAEHSVVHVERIDKANEAKDHMELKVGRGMAI